MPIHDWTRTDAGSYHDLHHDWTIEIRRDVEAINQRSWEEFGESPPEPRPAAKPLTVVSYDAGKLTAYIDPVAVGDPLPDAPLFLAPGWYVYLPLERTYEASWAETPQV